MKTITPIDLDSFNPDAMELSDLESAIEYLSDAARAAHELLPTFQPHGGQSQIIKLWLYCICKSEAMKLRVAGRVDHAMQFEAQCEELYSRLTPPLRW